TRTFRAGLESGEVVDTHGGSAARWLALHSVNGSRGLEKSGPRFLFSTSQLHRSQTFLFQETFMVFVPPFLSRRSIILIVAQLTLFLGAEFQSVVRADEATIPRPSPRAIHLIGDE